MSNEGVINALEQGIKKAQTAKELGAALERLSKNADFKSVILTGYMRDEAVRLVHLKGDISFQSPEKQASILKQIDGIASLKQYFNVVELTADNAQGMIDEAEEHLVQLRADEGNE